MSKRIDSYVGPQKEIMRPSALSRFEDGNWVGQQKIDGCHCTLTTNHTGSIVSMVSRTGQAFEEARELIGCLSGLTDCVLVGEYEVMTQAAINAVSKNGVRCFWGFDIVSLMGHDVRSFPLEQRRALLEKSIEAIRSQPDPRTNRIKIVRQEEKGFAKFYKEVKAGGGEGLVLKKKGSLYKSQTSDGRTTYWVRVKDVVPVDLYVIGTGLTPSRAVNLRVGLWRKGKPIELQSLALPKGYTAEQLVGTVIECEYDTQLESGKYRHLRFVRPRPDKTKEMCG
jgi:ATP-dependent DNA ligase